MVVVNRNMNKDCGLNIQIVKSLKMEWNYKIRWKDIPKNDNQISIVFAWKMYFARFKIKKEWIYYYLCPTWTYAFRLYLQLCTCSSGFMINSMHPFTYEICRKLVIAKHYSFNINLFNHRMTLQCYPSYMRCMRNRRAPNIFLLL